jgi:hypothetical protein
MIALMALFHWHQEIRLIARLNCVINKSGVNAMADLILILTCELLTPQAKREQKHAHTFYSAPVVNLCNIFLFMRTSPNYLND